MSLTETVGAACVAALVAVLLVSAGRAQPTDDPIMHLKSLETELASLEHEITLLEDTKAIKRLQRAYGYYVDKKLSHEIAALFADDPGDDGRDRRLRRVRRQGSDRRVLRSRHGRRRPEAGPALQPHDPARRRACRRRRPHRQRPVASADRDRRARQERDLGRRPVRERVRQRERRLEIQQGALVPDVLGALLARLAQGAGADESAARGLSARSPAVRGLQVVSRRPTRCRITTRIRCRAAASRGFAMRSSKAIAALVVAAALASFTAIVLGQSSDDASMRIAALRERLNGVTSRADPRRRHQPHRESPGQLRLLRRQDALGRSHRSLRRRRHTRDRPERRLRRQGQHPPLSLQLERRQAGSAAGRAERSLRAPADRHRGAGRPVGQGPLAAVPDDRRLGLGLRRQLGRRRLRERVRQSETASGRSASCTGMQRSSRRTKAAG